MCLGLCGFAFLAQGEDVQISATVDPIKSGSGPNLTARFNNVATVDGKTIDLFGEILSQSSNKTNDFWQGPPWGLEGDFVFQFLNMVEGEHREAVVRWTFFEEGTNTPVVFENFTLTIDDLDHKLSGGDGRTETVSTADADRYTIDSSNDLSINLDEETVSVTGGSNQSPGDPKGAVKFHFSNLSSFTMSYSSIARGATRSAFHHDGQGAFTFDDPVETDLGVRLYYTFNLTNREGNAVLVNFSDNLGSGLTWDPDFVELTGNLAGDGTAAFSGGSVSIDNLTLQPGTVTLRLRTKRTLARGIIYNEATVNPGHPRMEPLVRSATVVLP